MSRVSFPLTFKSFNFLQLSFNLPADFAQSPSATVGSLMLKRNLFHRRQVLADVSSTAFQATPRRCLMQQRVSERVCGSWVNRLRQDWREMRITELDKLHRRSMWTQMEVSRASWRSSTSNIRSRTSVRPRERPSLSTDLIRLLLTFSHTPKPSLRCALTRRGCCCWQRIAVDMTSTSSAFNHIQVDQSWRQFTIFTCFIVATHQQRFKTSRSHLTRVGSPCHRFVEQLTFSPSHLTAASRALEHTQLRTLSIACRVSIAPQDCQLTAAPAAPFWWQNTPFKRPMQTHGCRHFHIQLLFFRLRSFVSRRVWAPLHPWHRFHRRRAHNKAQKDTRTIASVSIQPMTRTRSRFVLPRCLQKHVLGCWNRRDSRTKHQLGCTVDPSTRSLLSLDMAHSFNMISIRDMRQVSWPFWWLLRSFLTNFLFHRHPQRKGLRRITHRAWSRSQSTMDSRLAFQLTSGTFTATSLRQLAHQGSRHRQQLESWHESDGDVEDERARWSLVVAGWDCHACWAA